MNRRWMLRSLHDQLESFNDLYESISEKYRGANLDAILDELGPVVDKMESAYWQVRKISDDNSSEIVSVQSDLKAVLGEDSASMVFVEGRKIVGAFRNGMWRGKSGRKSFRYRRPSGFVMFAPENGLGTELCEDDGFMIVARLVIPKLEDEVAWIKAGKPRQYIWARIVGSQQAA